MALVVRYPKIDFSRIPAHWAPNVAFAQDRNATSLIPTPIEPWLIKIVQKTIDLLPPEDADLREDAAGFIAQESQHFRQHRLFNKMLIAQGYPKLADYEQQLASDLDGYLKTRSHKFLLAYADGFESLGAVAGGVWFEKSDAFIEGADANAVRLWKWHMAEEFEHREVCFKLFHALYGRGFFNAIVNGYFYRLYGFLFAMRHLGSYSKRMCEYMIEIDRASMSETERARLAADMKVYKAFRLKTLVPQLLKNFLPWYNPGRKRVPHGLMEYLAHFEPGGDFARPLREPAVGGG